MALTSLEAIAQKLDETRSSELESVLRVSGSSAVSKNEYGVTVVDEKNVASSLLFKSLTAPKYDEEEILKAIDVEVKELKPVIPERNLNLVPKPLYDEQVALVEDLRKQVQSLTAKVEALNSQIVTLKAQVQTEINNRLSVDQTRMGQRLVERDVRVAVLHVLADHRDVDLGFRIRLGVDHALPRGQIGGLRLRFESEFLDHDVIEPLLVQQERNFVDVARIDSRDDCPVLDIGEERDLASMLGGQRIARTAEQDVGLDTDTA